MVCLNISWLSNDVMTYDNHLKIVDCSDHFSLHVHPLPSVALWKTTSEGFPQKVLITDKVWVWVIQGARIFLPKKGNNKRDIKDFGISMKKVLYEWLIFLSKIPFSYCIIFWLIFSTSRKQRKNGNHFQPPPPFSRARRIVVIQHLISLSISIKAVTFN